MSQPEPSFRCMQPGYVLEDRVLRPAMVVVAKGGEQARRSDEGRAGRKASDDAA